MIDRRAILHEIRFRAEEMLTHLSSPSDTAPIFKNFEEATATLFELIKAIGFYEWSGSVKLDCCLNNESEALMDLLLEAYVAGASGPDDWHDLQGRIAKSLNRIIEWVRE